MTIQSPHKGEYRKTRIARILAPTNKLKELGLTDESGTIERDE